MNSISIKKFKNMKSLISIIALSLLTTMSFGQNYIDSINYYVQKANDLPKENHSQKIIYLDKAIEFCNKSSLKTMLFLVVQNRINEYIQINEYSHAEKDYLWLIEENDKSPYFGIGNIYWGLANLYRDTKKYKQGLEYYEKAISSNVTIGKFIIYLDYSKCLTSINKYSEAIENINKGLTSLANNDPNVIQINYYKSPGNIPAEYFLLMQQRAKIYFLAEKKKKGCEDLEEILKLFEVEKDIFNIHSNVMELKNKECK